MSQKIKTHSESEYGDAAAASKRLIAATVTGALLVGGAVAGSAVEHTIRDNERTASINEGYTQKQDVLAEISKKALERVDPANIVGIFDITPGSNVNGLSNEILETLPAYELADKETKDFIDFTVLESGTAQGVYDENDTFVISKAEIDGKQTFIIQDGTGVEPGVIASPDTH